MVLVSLRIVGAYFCCSIRVLLEVESLHAVSFMPNLCFQRALAKPMGSILLCIVFSSMIISFLNCKLIVSF